MRAAVSHPVSFLPRQRRGRLAVADNDPAAALFQTALRVEPPRLDKLTHIS